MKTLRVLPWTLLLFLIPAACMRQDLRHAEIHLPDATPEDLSALRLVLLREQQESGREEPLYPSIVAQQEPPLLRVSFDARRTALKNIEHLLADQGFDANDVPGNPERLQAFRDALHTP